MSAAVPNDSLTAAAAPAVTTVQTGPLFSRLLVDMGAPWTSDMTGERTWFAAVLSDLKRGVYLGRESRENDRGRSGSASMGRFQMLGRGYLRTADLTQLVSGRRGEDELCLCPTIYI